MTRLTEAQLGELRLRHACDATAAQWVALRRLGRRKVGPCPICSADRSSKDATRFEVTADNWVCAVCADGGDVIRLVQKVQGLDFLGAVAWLGGARDLDPAEAERRERERQEKAERREREASHYREKERRKLFDIWRHALHWRDSIVAEYLALRLGPVALPPTLRLRCVPDMPYFRDGKHNAEVIARAPAKLAPITDHDGRFAGLHLTYIDLSQPKGKLVVRDPETGELLPAKKVRGSKAGNAIELLPHGAPARLVLGEGIEKVLAVALALEQVGRLVTPTAFWVASDLGNLGGKAKETVPHPMLKTDAGRVRRVPGPEPDMDAPGLPIPDSVEDMVLLGDSTSDRFLTSATLVRAARRYARPGRQVRAAWAPDRVDFDDMLARAA